MIPLPEVPGGETDETDRQEFFKRVCGMSAHVVWAGGRNGRTGRVSMKHRCCGLTHANCAGDVGGVAGFAGAAVGTQRVDALTVLAQVSHHATLVNVWMETRES